MEDKLTPEEKQTLRRSKQIILMTEFWPKGLREAGGTRASISKNYPSWDSICLS
jgi:hypothetical protein